MSELKSITFGFENCELLTIPAHMIGDMEIGDIKTTVRRIASNSISKMLSTDFVFIELFDNCKSIATSCGDDLNGFERLTKYSDITSIDLDFEDGSKIENIYVDYCEDSDTLGANNKNQSFYVSKQNVLYILIDKTRNIKDYIKSTYDKELIECFDDKEYVTNKKDRYDIGVEKEEKHPYNRDSLPEMYRLVYLEDSVTNKQALACRVYDADCGWKFVYADDDIFSDNITTAYIHFPTSWKYPTSKINMYLNEISKNFTIENIKKKYPPYCLDTDDDK